MNHRKKKKVSILAVLATFATMLSGCAGCSENTKPVATTPTVGVTATTAPTVTAEAVTKEPEYTPTAIPDTPTPVPTVTPVPTPTIAPSPTPEPTATPVPTSTPTPVVKVEGKPEYRFQMGDNVFYEYYENSTVLVVTGTGSTWDFDDYKLIPNGLDNGAKKCSRKKLLEKNPNAVSEVWAMKTDPEGPKKIVVEEGITRLGREALAAMGKAEYISLPESLVEIGEIAFMNTGTREAEWVGLDFFRIDIADNAFFYCYNVNIEEMVQYRATPTPTPTPTATPVPNPDKPRLVESRKMGDNVTFEFWDNGFLYVKGTGKTWDQSFYFDDFEDEFYMTIDNIIVEEGITYLGNFVFTHINSVSYCKFPKSLTSVGNTWGGNSKGMTFYGYMDDKPITIVTPGSAGPGTFFDVIADIEKARENGYIITFD